MASPQLEDGYMMIATEIVDNLCLSWRSGSRWRKLWACRRGKAYSVIRELNAQLSVQGYLVISGKINKRYFEEKCLCGATMEGD